MAKASEELKQKAKEAGISSWHVKSAEVLEAELLALEIEADLDPVEEVAEVEEAKPKAEKPKKQEVDLLTALNGVSLDEAYMKILMRGNRSKFYPYRKEIAKRLGK